MKSKRFTIQFFPLGGHGGKCIRPSIRITRCHDKASDEMLVNPELAKEFLASIRAKKVTVLP